MQSFDEYPCLVISEKSKFRSEHSNIEAKQLIPGSGFLFDQMLYLLMSEA